MIPYYKISLKNTLDYLKNKVSESILSSLYDKYNIEGEQPEEQLAEIISDEDMYALGFPGEVEDDFSVEDDTETQNCDAYCDYKYDNLAEVIEVLADSDEDLINHLCDKYDCYSLTDLALALTDAELDKIFEVYDETHPTEDETTDEEKPIDIFESCEYYNGDYEEDLDYLEDIPCDLKFYIIDPVKGLFMVDNDYDYLRFKESLDGTLIDECVFCEDESNTAGNGRVVFKIKPHKFEVSEDVVINDKLNPEIFDENNNVKPDISEQLINYVDGFVSYAADKSIMLPGIVDIELIGSNAGYLYQPDSDIDIHMIVDKPLQPEFAEQLFNEFDLYEAENPLMIGDSKVELGIEDGYEVATNTKDARKYSLVNSSWVDDSDKQGIYSKDDLSSVSGYEEIVNELAQQIDNVVDNDKFDQALELKNQIRQNRSDDLANIGSLSLGNVVFKELRNMGSYDKLRNYIREKEIEFGDMWNG